MPDRGRVHITIDGRNVGPGLPRREAEVVARWLSDAHRALVGHYRRYVFSKLPGWRCPCACHRHRKSTLHCVGCANGKRGRDG